MNIIRQALKKLPLFAKFLFVLSTITGGALLLAWLVVYPKYETAVIAERMTHIQQLQRYSIETLDRTIAHWSDIVRFVAGQVKEHPMEGESILRTTMALHSHIIHIKIQSPRFSDELISQNTSYPALNLHIEDSMWVRAKFDSLFQVAWFNRTDIPPHLFVMKTQFQVKNIPFDLIVTWDAKQLNDILSELPIDQDYSLSIHSLSHMIMHYASSFKLVEQPGALEKTSAHQSVREGNVPWQIVTGAFQTVKIWMIIAVAEETIIKPVKDIFSFFTWLIIGLMFIILFFGWTISRRTKRTDDLIKIEIIDHTSQ